MDEQENAAAEPFSADDEALVKPWHKPVVTVIQANSAENGPGLFPDAGIDYS